MKTIPEIVHLKNYLKFVEENKNSDFSEIAYEIIKLKNKIKDFDEDSLNEFCDIMKITIQNNGFDFLIGNQKSHKINDFIFIVFTLTKEKKDIKSTLKSLPKELLSFIEFIFYDKEIKLSEISFSFFYYNYFPLERMKYNDFKLNEGDLELLNIYKERFKIQLNNNIQAYNYIDTELEKRDLIQKEACKNYEQESFPVMKIKSFINFVESLIIISDSKDSRLLEKILINVSKLSPSDDEMVSYELLFEKFN